MNMQYLLQHLFKKSSLEEVPLAAFKELVRKHPYFAAGQLLLAKKLQQQGDQKDFTRQVQKTSLYFHDPVWLDQLIGEKQETDMVAFNKQTSIPVPEATAENKEDDLLFEPYHTIDYFASLGIKLSQELKPDDKFGNQLKSFTEWLKTLRRLPEAMAEEAGNREPDTNADIEKIAASSLEEKEVVTEAMAEVLILQGKKEKALAVYNKLSLLNPDKRAYFADRIEQLKA